MEWVETTARTVEEAQELALDQLGVIADEAEFEIVATPRPGLFGRLRGEARVRARVRPAPVRPKQERRRGGRRGGSDRQPDAAAPESPARGGRGRRRSGEPDRPAGDADAGDQQASRPTQSAGAITMTTADSPTSDHGDVVGDGASNRTGDPAASDDRVADGEAADVAAVRDAAVGFVSGLTEAFGFDATVASTVEGNEIEVRVDGGSLGLLIGPGGRTLLAVQDLTRVAAQRRLGDHETRLRVDVAGYREKRRVALERFAATVAEQVRTTGVARSLDPMPSADRKVLHDALAAMEGVSSRSEGEDPNRRVIVTPS